MLAGTPYRLGFRIVFEIAKNCATDGINTSRSRNISYLNKSDVEFVMLDANISHAISKLDQVRRNEKKFLCINDDMNHASEEIEVVKNLLSDLYLTFFPKPSQFELPHEYRNRKLFKSEKTGRDKLHCTVGSSVDTGYTTV